MNAHLNICQKLDSKVNDYEELGDLGTGGGLRVWSWYKPTRNGNFLLPLIPSLEILD